MNPSLYPTQPSIPPAQPFNLEPANPEPSQRKSKRPLVIALVIAALVVIGGVSAWYFLAPKGPVCLTRADYQTLAGEALPDEAPFAPTVDFYGLEMEFAADSTTYADSTMNTQLQKIGEFAVQHPNTSLRVTLEAIYRDDTPAATKDLITQRIQNAKKSLQDAGVTTQSLTTKLKTYTADPYDDASGNGSIVSLAITSDSACRISN